MFVEPFMRLFNGRDIELVGRRGITGKFCGVEGRRNTGEIQNSIIATIPLILTVHILQKT